MLTNNYEQLRSKNVVFIFHSLNNLNCIKLTFLTPANYEKTIPCPKCIKTL